MELRQAGINYIKRMTPDERIKLQIMLSEGVICGSDYAKQNELDPKLFTQELILIFKGK